MSQQPIDVPGPILIRAGLLDLSHVAITLAIAVRTNEPALNLTDEEAGALLLELAELRCRILAMDKRISGA